ncbi:unnamed protein product [Linum trigynum]|uniref:Uncharacterized protein n=1 Tax=Linum trigynum TaxID=586398 RepID=A0AAV2EA28_9ROSI
MVSTQNPWFAPPEAGVRILSICQPANNNDVHGAPTQLQLAVRSASWRLGFFPPVPPTIPLFSPFVGLSEGDEEGRGESTKAP